MLDIKANDMNRTLINAVRGTTLLLCAFAMCACGKTLQGSYKHTFSGRYGDVDNVSLTSVYDFNSDGTVAETMTTSLDNDHKVLKGTYAINGNVVTITWTSPPSDQTESMTIQGDVLTGNGNDSRYERQ